MMPSSRIKKLSDLIRADLAGMEGEIHADGILTHITRRKEKCPLYGTDFQTYLSIILSSFRSERSLIRNYIGARQQTISTRGWKYNHHKRWDAQYRVKPWKCPFCDLGWTVEKPVLVISR